jgi:hypothetical protein
VNHFHVPVAFLNGTTAFANNLDVIITFVRTGDRGDTGATGYWGSVGYTGSVGYWGSVGYTGSVGYSGSTGYTGSNGYWGSVGYTGSVGYWGSKGDTGYWGSKGDAGYWGSGGGGGTPGGANTQVQFNDSGAFGGSAGFTFDKTTNNVTIANSLIMNTQSISVASGANTLTINPFNMFTGAGNSFAIAANNNNFTSIFIAANGNIGIQNNNPGAVLSIGSNTMVLGSSSKADPGYAWLPNGILMQWGTVSASTTVGNVTFPVTFPTAILGVTVTPATTYIVNGYPNVIAQTTSTCNVRTGSTTSRTMFWQALGY